MSDSLKVTFNELADGSTMLRNGSSDIQGQLDTMRNRLEPIHASWQGAAKGQFDALWQEWERAAHNLRESLEGVAQLLSVAAQSYEEAEGQIRQSFTQ